MAWPTLGILDSGVRANEDPLSHGGDWTADDVTHPYIISSNKIVPKDSTYPGALWKVGFAVGPDMEMYITQDVLGGSSAICAFWARFSGSTFATGTGYLAYLFPSGAGQGPHGFSTAVIVKRVAGSDATLNTVGTITMAGGDQYGFGLVGSALNVYINGTSVLSASNPDITAAGRWGIQSNATTGTFSNFGGGTLGGAAPTGISGSGGQIFRVARKPWRF